MMPAQRPEARLLMSTAAKARELRNLATRAKCSLEVAEARKRGGEKYCKRHGWYSEPKCRVCLHGGRP